MSDPSHGRLPVREQLLEIDRRLRAIQLQLAPHREAAPPLVLPAPPVAPANTEAEAARGRIGPLSELLERSREEAPGPASMAAEVRALAEVGRSFVRLQQSLELLLEDLRAMLERAPD
jgi:hypothetical protein